MPTETIRHIRNGEKGGEGGIEVGEEEINSNNILYSSQREIKAVV